MKTAKEISALLANQIEAVVLHLLPQGNRDGNEWRVGSIEGQQGKSLGVHLTGHKAGVWCDFATQESGDVLSLWAKVRNLSLREAIIEVSEWLGIGKAPLLTISQKKWKRPPVAGNALNEVESTVINYLVHERKLKKETLEAFQIREKRSADGKWYIIFPFYSGSQKNELVLNKYLGVERPLTKEGRPKKDIRVEKDCEPILFGWQALNSESRTLVICEGEIDCLTLHQYGFSALSIPFGVNNDKWIEQDFDLLAMFDEIYLSMDNDDAGNKAALRFAERLGTYRCRIVKLPHKDANDCLLAGMSADQIKLCFQEAEYVGPVELKKIQLLSNLVIEKLHSSRSEAGYGSFLEKSKGKILFRPGELSIWCGINGHGKSLFLGQLMLDFFTQNARICIASLEMRSEILLSRLARQASGLSLPSAEYIEAIHNWYGDKGWLFNLVGTAKQDRLLTCFLYAKQRYNVDVFIIDSLLKCGLAEDDYNGQKLFVEQLCDFKNEHNVHIHLVAHPRKGDDELTPPNKMNVKGTGAITDLADNVFSIFRNKKKEKEIDKVRNNGGSVPPDLEEEYDSLLICDKQRNGDWEKAFSIWFDPLSLQFLNTKGQKPRQYVHYSKLEANK